MSLYTNDLDTIQECFGDGILMFFDALVLGLLALYKNVADGFQAYAAGLDSCGDHVWHRHYYGYDDDKTLGGTAEGFL